MKKLFVAALAVLGLAACSNDEVLDAPRSGAIKFDNAFIDAATRAAVDPSTTTESIAGFNVWAFMNEYDGTVFNAEDVQRNGNSWSYLNTQYWAPANNYYFAALSPMDSENVKNLVLAKDEAAKLGLGSFDFTNVNGTEDLLYAKAIVETNEDINIVPAPVKMQFQHLLSKVKFTFTNGFTTDNASVVVRNITMTAPAGASIDLAQADYSEAWALNGEEVTLAFGNVEKIGMGANAECADERLTIPADENQVYTVKFQVELFMGAQSAMVVEKEATVVGTALEMGKAYNFTAEINPENLNMAAIEFAVVVEDWVEAGDVATVSGTPIASYNELVEFLAAANREENDGRCVLVNNIAGDLTIEQKEGVNITINGNGNEFNGTITVNGQSSTTTNKSLVIRNLNFVTEKAEMDFIYSGSDAVRYARNLTIENCTFTAPEGSDVVALRLRQAYNTVVKGCTMNGGHSLAQITSNNAGIVFEGCTVVNAGRGINLGNAINDGAASVINCDINVIKNDGYGVRVDAKGAETLNVSGSRIEAVEPIVLRNAQAAFTFNIESTELISKGEYQVVITGQIPAMNGVENYAVYAPVTSVSSFAAALNNTNVSDIEITSAIDNGTAAITVQGNDVVLNMAGNEVKAGGNNTNNYAFHLYDTDIEINDANINGGGLAVMQGSNVTVNSGVIAAKPGDKKTSRNIFYVVGNSSVTVNDGDYSFDRTSSFFVYVDEGSTCYINGGNFYKPLANNATKDAFVNPSSKGTVVITGGTFNVNPSAWVADGYEAVQNGSTWTVQAK